MGRNAGREGTLDKSPKFYNNVSLFVALTTLGTLMNFDFLVHLVDFLN